MLKKLVFLLLLFLCIKPHTISAIIPHNLTCNAMVITTASTAVGGGLVALASVLINRQLYTKIPAEYNSANDGQALRRQERSNRIISNIMLAGLGVAAVSIVALIITTSVCS